MSVKSAIRKWLDIEDLKRETAVGFTDPVWQTWIGSKDKDALSEATYYICLKTLSETIGKIPLKYYQKIDKGTIPGPVNDVDAYVLGTRPNRLMTASTFWSAVELNCQHTGNSYVYLHHTFAEEAYGGSYELDSAWLMPSNAVVVLMDDTGVFGNRGDIYYQYTDSKTGEMYLFKSSEVLHFKTWMTWDGLVGKSALDILKDTAIAGLEASDEYLTALNKNGMSAGYAMQYAGELDDGRINALQKKFDGLLTGPQNAGKVVPIPLGLQLTPLKMSNTDSQYYELRKYSALQVAAAFGIKPNQINDYEKSSYANSETQQLAFLVDTMSARLKLYEEEINYKVLSRKKREAGFYYKFNEKALLRTDSKSQMEQLSAAVTNGIYTPNEARAKLDLPAMEGGDKLYINGGSVPLVDINSGKED